MGNTYHITTGYRILKFNSYILYYWQLVALGTIVYISSGSWVFDLYIILYVLGASMFRESKKRKGNIVYLRLILK